MGDLRDGQNRLVGENGTGEVKGNAVFAEICSRLDVVPFKLKLLLHAIACYDNVSLRHFSISMTLEIRDTVYGRLLAKSRPRPIHTQAEHIRQTEMLLDLDE